MLLHVSADTGAESVLPEIGFHHPNNGLALRIGDRIERRERLGFVGDRLLDRMAGAARILAHGCLLEAVAVEPGLPVRMKRLGRLRLHPRCETFVEPDVVPPRHGDEIAEPLVGYL